MSEALKKILEEKARTATWIHNELYYRDADKIGKCILLEDFEGILKDFVVVSRAEYDGQVHVPRKQLSERSFPIVTLCGSSKQKDDWIKYQRELALKGYCVLNINVYLGVETPSYNDENGVKQLLRELHRQKIRMADIIAVIPKPDGSVGSHTKEEIVYAKSLGKKVVLHVKELLEASK